jgi:hypothetical protein
MVDPIAISAIIIAAVTAISGAAAALHIRRMHSGCLDCDCVPIPRSPSASTVKQTITLQPITTNEV